MGMAHPWQMTWLVTPIKLEFIAELMNVSKAIAHKYNILHIIISFFFLYESLLQHLLFSTHLGKIYFHLFH